MAGLRRTRWFFDTAVRCEGDAGAAPETGKGRPLQLKLFTTNLLAV
jgi:hypothetical protein